MQMIHFSDIEEFKLEKFEFLKDSMDEINNLEIFSKEDKKRIDTNKENYEKVQSIGKKVEDM